MAKPYKANPLIKINDERFFSPSDAIIFTSGYQKGDTVRYSGNAYALSSGSNYVIDDVYGFPLAKVEEYRGVFYPLVDQRVKLNGRYGSSATVKKSQLTLIAKGSANEMANTLQIAVDRPCLVFELETDADGKDKVKDPKKGKPFDSMSAAKAWVEEQIVTSIRENNVYPKYSVYEERFVGRAEKPPVVFE